MLVTRTSEAAVPAVGEVELPRRPLVVIEAGKRRFLFKLSEFWEYRELLYFLIWRDIKVRYKQTALGVVWVVLQPLLMMMIFTLFFGKLAGIRADDGIPYPLFAYAGLLPWTFFATAANSAGNSLVNSASLITKIYFPRLMVPVAAVGAVLVDLAISFCVLAVLMVYWRIPPNRGLVVLPLLICLVTGLALAFGTLMTALNVRYRDVKIALPFLLQIWFFVSPIIYPVSILPARWHWVMALNPMTGIAEGFRAALYGRKPFAWTALAISGATTLVLFAIAMFTFKRMEKSFADII
ncbi:MAG: lipopolysaccharide transport system permease protein [Pyrinomonadaceae bacterium]|jgi:lipopolysaccharide transport system permease protein|nr:lipopolysaccharide transport system permease protein [Pyrinomonadaceae bacterium]